MGESEGEVAVEKLKLKRTALLIDIENLIGTAREIALPIDVSRIVEKLLESCRLAIRRSYGDLDAAVRGDWDLKKQVRASLVDNLVQIEDVPSVGRKNSADIKLTVDAVATAYSRPDIDQFAIVSSDRDYVPLVLKLRELGREVIGIGTSPDTVNKLYVKACDRFLYYSSLLPPSYAAKGADLVQDRTATLDDYLQLLCEAVEGLDRQGKTASGGQIVPLMRQRRPDYDPALVGLKSFRELVDAARKRGLIEYKTSGMDVIVWPAARPPVPAPGPAAPSGSEFEPADTAESYRRFYRQKLKCDLPGQGDRSAIYAATADVLADAGGQPIELDELSRIVAERIDHPAATKTVIFKILYGLFRGQVFVFFPSEQPFNPRIAGVAADRAEWDFRFVANCLRVLGRERPDWPVDVAGLASALQVDQETIEAGLRTLE